MKKISLIASALVIAVLLVAAPQFAGAASPDDDALARAVSEKLMSDKEFDATSIIVTAKDGVVLLRGESTETDVEKDKAAEEAMKQSAMGVPGVKRVDIDITSGNAGS